MVLKSSDVISLPEIDVSYAHLVGEQAVELGSLAQNQIPIVPGFCISNLVWEQSLADCGITLDVTKLMASANPADPESISQVSAKINRLIESKLRVPRTLASKISQHYHHLGQVEMAQLSASIIDKDIPESLV